MDAIHVKPMHLDYEIYNKVGRLRGNYKYGALARKVLGGTLEK